MKNRCNNNKYYYYKTKIYWTKGNYSVRIVWS